MNQLSNNKIAEIFLGIAELLEIKGTKFKPAAYRRASLALRKLPESVEEIYKRQGLKGLDKIEGVGKSIARDIEQYLKKGKIKRFEELKQETAIRQVITHYFKTKGLSLAELKNDAKKRKIVYSRYTKPAKQLLELAGGIENAKKAIDTVAEWAKSRNLDYAIETVFKKWLELDRLKPKKNEPKPFYDGKPMVQSRTNKKWYVIDDNGEWLEFADKESKIDWRVVE